LKPLLGYFGKLGLSTGVNLASDYLAGKNFKESAKERVKEAGKTALAAGLKRGETFLQTGQGRRKKQVGVKKRNTRKRKLDVAFPAW